MNGAFSSPLHLNLIRGRPVRLGGIALALVLAASANVKAAGNQVRVTAQVENGAVRVEAQALLRATLPVVWQTLTDYEHLNSFIPGMATSKLIERRGVAAIVEQTGEARFLFFSYPLDVTVSSEEYPPFSIRIHVLKGNLSGSTAATKSFRFRTGKLICTGEASSSPTFFFRRYSPNPSCGPSSRRSSAAWSRKSGGEATCKFASHKGT